MALLIIGLLGFGKFTSSLDPSSALYVGLIQLHKSFGITVLLLAVMRLLWRISHTPPPLPTTDPAWQRFAASATHGLVYVLMFAIPLTGWVMVSSSPMNLNTVLFGVIPWPHLPPFPTLANREYLAELLHTLHELGGNILIVLLLLHMGAALKHHLINKDHVLRRMLPDWGSRTWRLRFTAACVGVAAAISGLYLYAGVNRSVAIVAAGNAEVSFIANVTDNDTPGVFADAEVSATIDETTPANSHIEATVQTGSVSSTDSSVDGSIQDPDWFDVENHPEATFVSNAVSAADAPDTLRVDGTLTIKALPLDVSFPMRLETSEAATAEPERHAVGEFTVDRRAFQLGDESQPDDAWVGYDVIIRFRFPVGAADS